MMNAQLEQPLSINPQDARQDLRMSPFHLAERMWALRWPSAAISHYAKLIYLPVPKVANSAILTAMVRIEQRAGLAPRFRDPHTNEPSHLEWLKPLSRTAWSRVFAFNRGYVSFTAIRNPCARLVSCYLDKIRGSFDGMEISRTEVYDAFRRYNLLLRHRVFWPDMTFDQFARRVCWIPDIVSDPHWRSQYTRFVTPRNDVVADRIYLLEHPEALYELFSQHGVELAPVRQSNRYDWREFYTPNAIAGVERRYARDFEIFRAGDLR